ncbi:MAG: hypothetical protein DSM107014_12205 [Gomphosphaeria aponina SAG 52.96 = DSM 107014]|uniref:Uncharacterized protein n=1 Tax=Gomphosphaeria aponina SAG 52.96 = DSM 107014 TaxID=1521640 RepID=A0A941JVB0_9CHRO|nr:hypothetical protein [Gomphosphaeria aponina SAG 52.96 = DSM 107014]
MNDYKSSPETLASWFLDSREKWKKRALHKQKEIRKAGIKIRDLENSRDKWKEKAKNLAGKIQEMEEIIKELKEETELLKKKEDKKLTEKPINHSFSVAQITISIQQLITTAQSFRGIEKTWFILMLQIQEIQEIFNKIPSYSVVRQWLYRLGLFVLQKDKIYREDWIWIIDLTVQLGQEKCLVILGIPEEKLNEKMKNNQGNLQYKDVEVLEIRVMTSTRGENIKEVLMETEENVGVPVQIISDKGSDIRCGIELYKKENKQVIHTHDFTHKIALFWKKELENNPNYKSFIKKCHETRRKLQQTKNSFLMPPNQRNKCRFFNIKELVNWGLKIIKYLNKTLAKNQLEKELSSLLWIKEYEEDLQTWSQMLLVVEEIETKIKKEGLNQQFLETYEQQYQYKTEKQGEKLDKWLEKIKTYLLEEKEKIESEKVLCLSNDVIESIFGKYKLFSERGPLKEIGLMILIIPLLTIEITAELVKQGLETVSNLEVQQWKEEILGASMLSKRKIAFESK